MSEQSTLDDLLVDEDELNEALLTQTVGRYTQIGKESGDLVPKEAYNDLTSKKKIVVGLLAQKARHELGLSDEEWLPPAKISELTGVKTGTVYPSVRELEDEGILRNDDGSYKIPSVNIEQAKEYLED